MPVQSEVPKSRTTITYKVEIDGEPAVVELPFRLMIPGDFSLGTSKDRKVDLEERNIRNLNGSNTSDVIKDMGISLEMVVSNRINPDAAESIRVNLSVDGLGSFSPDKVADQVPQIRSLLLFKKLLEEIQSNIANKKEFANLLNKLYADQQALNKIKEELKELMPALPKKEINIIEKKPE